MDAPPAPAGPKTQSGSRPQSATEEEDLEARLERLRGMFDMDILGAAAHEGWHQYFHWYVVSWCELPSWINEGVGDYFYTAIPKTEKGKRLPCELGRKFPMRLLIVKHAVQQGQHVPLKEFLRYERSQYYANPSVCYAQGWALCQFLLHSGNPAYQRIIPAFVLLVRDDTNMEVVTARAFKGIDLDKLEQEFLAWVKGQTLDV